MQRRRSIPHTLEDRIAAEMARLEAQAARVRHMDEFLRDQELKTASHAR